MDKLKKLPAEGIHIDLQEGQELTRIHLDLAQDGISLATVGAATSALAPGERQRITLKQTPEGLVLSLVGAAVAAKP